MEFFKKNFYSILGSAFGLIIIASLFIVFYFIVGILGGAVKSSQVESQYSNSFDLAGYQNIKSLVEKNGVGNVPAHVDVAPAPINPAAASVNTALLDKTKISISILNGTNTSGLASHFKKFFEENGFIVTKIGNSSTPAVKTIIKIKNDKKDYLSLILDLISEKYSPSIEQVLTDSGTHDVEIIIGEK